MANESKYSVDPGHPTAVYQQIQNQVRFAITRGLLKPGDTLPSVRHMSSVLGINPNTVTKAYRELELLGLVNTRRGVGATVARGAPDKCRDATLAMAEAHLRSAVAQCRAAGMEPQAIKRLAANAIATDDAPYQTDKRN